MKPSIEVLKIAIKALKEQDKKDAQWMKMFDEMTDTRGIPNYNTTLSTAIVNMLQEVYKDKYDWIPYWIWEAEYGKKAKIWDNDVEIPVKTIEQFYNFLMDEYFNEDIELPKVEDYKDYTSKTIYVDIKEDKPQEDYFKITC